MIGDNKALLIHSGKAGLSCDIESLAEQFLKQPYHMLRHYRVNRTLIHQISTGPEVKIGGG